MKRIGFITAALSVPLFFACETEEPLNQQNFDEATVAAESEAAMNEVFEEVDDIGFYGGLTVDEGGRMVTFDRRDTHLDCAVITHDKENQTIIIDYGDGCYSHGRFLQGKIIITYTDHILVPGAEQTLTFNNFYVDSVKVDGERIRKNIAEDFDDTLQFDIKLIDGKLTWPDGSEATRDAHWLVTRIRANNPLEDERWLDGEANGNSKSGVDYAVNIRETIVFKRGCRRPARVFLPVSGIKVITWRDHQRIVDYGDGECDRLVTITVDGESREITLRRRFFNSNN